jgi:hypothetical protein
VTIEEFMSDLEDARDQFDWTLQPSSGSGSDPGLCLRGTLRGVPTAVFDPLAAVSYVHTGRLIEATSWTDAARTLDMDPSIAAQVMAAANNAIDNGRGRRKASPDLSTLRKRLLGVVRVEEGCVPESAAPDRPPASARAAESGDATRRFSQATLRSESSTLRARLLPTALTLVSSVGVAALAVVVPTFLYVSTVFYLRGLSILVVRYGGPPVPEFTGLVGRPSTLWLIGLFVFTVTLSRRHPNVSFRPPY